MKDQWKKRVAAVAALVVATSLSLVAVMEYVASRPTLFVRGVEMNVMADGSVQMLFSVGVENMELSNGAGIWLSYNKDYLEPSDYTTNKPVEATESGEEPAFFSANPELYLYDTVDTEDNRHYPFPMETTGTGTTENTDFFNFVDSGLGKIGLNLFVRHDTTLKPGGLLTGEKYYAGEGYDDVYYGFEASDGVSLGTLSFNVKDLSLLPEIVREFGKDASGEPIVENELDPYGASEKRLVYFDPPRAEERNKGAWLIGELTNLSVKDEKYICTYNNLDNYVYTTGAGWSSEPAAQAAFTFEFPETIVSVEPAEPEVTLNAYQAYTDGTAQDVAAALQKYSPSVIVTYADGSQETHILNWSGCEVTAVDADGEPIAGYDPATNYDPTGDQTYRARQMFTYGVATDENGAPILDENGDPVPKIFPVPVTAKLTVTPVKLERVSADGLHRTYPLNDNLVDKDHPASVLTPGDMELPDEARLVTDVVVGGVSLTMDVHGWTPIDKNGDKKSRWPDPGESMATLLKDSYTDPTIHHWPTPEDTDQWDTVSEQRKGTYSFHMANYYGDATVDTFTKKEIQDAYPWMTVEKEEYSLGNATRKLVGTDQWVDNNLYQVAYISTKTDTANEQPTLTLQVSRIEGSNVVDMKESSLFRILLPDGTELGTGLKDSGAVGGSVTVDNWFDAPTGSGGTGVSEADRGYYRREENRNVGQYTNRLGFDLVTNPGDPTQGDDGTQRELLRRYINLGGWFHVSINEDTSANEWTNYIPVYVPPRENRYMEDKEYNFLGPNAGLFNWPGGLTTTVTLPKGSYWPVDISGTRLYEDGTSVPVSERYGVATTYDGATGAQPGELNTFTIEATSWQTNVSADGVTTYGPDAFKDGAVYNAYGAVYNYGYAATDGSSVVPKTATIRRDVTEAPAQVEAITLTYEQAGGGVTYGADGNVDLVTYNTKRVGYTVRQDYVLTITNVGTVDIYGLTIDSLTDDDDADYTQDGGGGHFVVLTPPASFLPVGESTTFTLSYVYNLQPVVVDGEELNYKDKLYITSNSRPKAVRNDPNTYLLDFDAQFQVTDDDLHRVTVLVDPAAGQMGTAAVIIGQQEQADGTYIMDTTAGSAVFPPSDEENPVRVYIAAWPKDEYAVYRVTAVNATGESFTPTLYDHENFPGDYPAPVPDGVEVYWFYMPDGDVTVTVHFYEPVESKLRLGEMVAYADEETTDLKPTTDTPAEYTIWQKSFTQEELDAAQDWEENDKGPSGEYLMTVGAATKSGISNVYSDPPEKTVQQYIVVIPHDADYAQVEVTLRHIIYTIDGTDDGDATNGIASDGKNDPIEPTVSMTLYPTSPVAGPVTVEQILPPTRNTSTTPPDPADPTTGPSVHYSEAFLSPTPGSSKYVRVDLIHQDDVDTTRDVTRSYYLEIHRAPKDPDATLHYGNSPYGMIMNDDDIPLDMNDDGIPLDKKEPARAAFVANRYSFAGLDAALVPSVVTENGLSGVHYWSEAWMLDVNARYDPESGYVTDSAGNSLLDENLDLNEYAFFAMQGEGFLDPGLKEARDSTGRTVDVSKATISLKALTLDETAADQQSRFQVPAADEAARTVALDLGPAAVTTADDWAGAARLRPGLYELTYSFPDYDGSYLTTTRPFVVLTPVGDVNGDGVVDHGASDTNGDGTVDDGDAKTDERLVEGRVTDPLGYEAAEYPNAAIFKYRCCDSNNDRNINNIDSNTIRTGTNLTEKFYLSTGYKPAT